jgi:uncharacterized membrane protein
MQKKKHDEHILAPHFHQHSKQDFQVERIAFFSDAIFAIAITLLVIDFRIPEVTKNSNYAEIWHEVIALKYKFFALILSFALISNYWMRHHLLFKHIHNYNRQLMVANMISLLPMIFFPFTTAFFYESTNNVDVLIIPFRLFILNNIVAGATGYFLYWTVTNKFKEFSYTMDKIDQREFELKLLGMVISFLLVFILSFFLPFEYSLLGILPMAVINFSDKYFRKKAVK